MITNEQLTGILSYRDDEFLVHIQANVLAQMAAELLALREQNGKLISALRSMADQYLQDRDGTYSHDFMSAGEETLPLLEELGYMREVAPETWRPLPSAPDAKGGE
jgi:hypothetical protein